MNGLKCDPLSKHTHFAAHLLKSSIKLALDNDLLVVATQDVMFLEKADFQSNSMELQRN